MPNKFEIDLDNATEEEMKKVQGMILSRLTRDVHLKVDNASPYDSHGSNHTNHSGRVIARGDIANPIGR